MQSLLSFVIGFCFLIEISQYLGFYDGDPRGPASGSWLVLRGGSFNYGANNLRAAYRLYDVPEYKYDRNGFRVVWLSAGVQN